MYIGESSDLLTVTWQATHKLEVLYDIDQRQTHTLDSPSITAAIIAQV